MVHAKRSRKAEKGDKVMILEIVDANALVLQCCSREQSRVCAMVFISIEYMCNSIS